MSQPKPLAMKFLVVLLTTLCCLFLFDSCKKKDTIDCQNQGVYMDGRCDCPDGYLGADCSIVDSCYNVTCYNGGVCVGGLCDCPPGFTGADCSVVDSCSNFTCLNGGVCVGGFCDCPSGFTGADCSVVDSCSNFTCLNGGVCVGGLCDCPPGFTGVDCSVVDSCYNVTCYNGGVCVGGLCDCPIGWGGSDCRTQVPIGQVTVDSIVVLHYAQTRASGAPWDTMPPSPPDIVLTLVQYIPNVYPNPQGTKLIHYGGVLADYIQPTISFSVGKTFDFWSTMEDWEITLSDFNYAFPREIIGYIQFRPDTYRNGGNQFTVTSTTGLSFTVEVYLTWNY